MSNPKTQTNILKLGTETLDTNTVTISGLSLDTGSFNIPATEYYNYQINGTSAMKLYDTGMKIDVINELTLNSGVTIEGALIKDSDITAGIVTLGGNPTANLHAATKQYVDSVANGLKWKAPVKYACGTNVDLATNGLTAVDGVALIAGERVLLFGQTAPAENGVYEAQVATWVGHRSADLTAGADFVKAAVFVQAGTANASKQYVCTNATAPNVGVDDITFVQFGGISGMTTLLVDTINESTLNAGVTVEGILLKDSKVNTDDILEKTLNHGINVDSLLIKDGSITDAANPMRFESPTSINLKLAGSNRLTLTEASFNAILNGYDLQVDNSATSKVILNGTVSSQVTLNRGTVNDDATIWFNLASVNKWKIGQDPLFVNGDFGVYSVATLDFPLRIIGTTGRVAFNHAVQTDTIIEYSAAAGVTIDSMLIKDGGFTATGLAMIDTTGTGLLKIDRTLNTDGANITFMDNQTDKWTIGTFSGSSDYKIYNNATAAPAITIAGANNKLTFASPYTNPLAGRMMVIAATGEVGYGTSTYLDHIDESTFGHGIALDKPVTITGTLDVSGILTVNVINKKSGPNITIESVTIAAGAIAGASETLSGTLGVDTIAEYTPAAGVTVDGVLIKDSGIVMSGEPKVDTINHDLSVSGVTIEGVVLNGGTITLTGAFNVDSIAEKTLGNGVVINTNTTIKTTEISTTVPLKIQSIQLYNIANPFLLGAGITISNAGNIDTATRVLTDTIAEHTGAAGVTIDGVLIKDYNITLSGYIHTDTIDEYTLNNGLYIEGVHFKDHIVSTDTQMKSDLINPWTGGGNVVINGVTVGPNKVTVTDAFYSNTLTERTGGTGITVNTGLLCKTTEISTTVPFKSDVINEKTLANGILLNTSLTVKSTELSSTVPLKIDAINEKTGAAGVTINVGTVIKTTEVGLTVPLKVDVINEKTGATGVTIEGLLLQANNLEVPGIIYVDTIAEYSGGDPGVTIDSVLLKDGGATLTGNLIVATNLLYANASTGFVGLGTATPARKLHVNNAMRLEPIATGSAPNPPAEGDIYYDLTLHKLRCYDGTTWQDCW